MNAKLLPEQRILRVIGRVFLAVFAWPIWLLHIYVESNRYGQAASDAFTDDVIVALAVLLGCVWWGFLAWLVLTMARVG